MTADVPRLDYLGSSCPSLLLEPQRTNLVTFSEQFDNASWVKSIGGTGVEASVVANAGISPSGYQDADLITLNSGTGTTASDQAKVTKNITGLTTGVAYSESIWLKGVSGGEQVLLGISNIGNLKVTLTTEWQRFVLSGVSGGVFNSVGVQIRRGLQEPLNSYAQFYAWGAQFEVGSYPTSYIPTLGTSVTRVADAASKTGISDLINSNGGVLYFEGRALSNVSGYIAMLSLSNGTDLNRVVIYYNDTRIRFLTQFNNIAVAAQDLTFADTTSVKKIAVRYGSGNNVIYVNGVSYAMTINGSYSVSAGTLSQFNLSNPAGTVNYDAELNSVIVFPTALSNTELAQLTTL
jgi:hypothetical protein